MLLRKIQYFFGVGIILERKNRNVVVYSVQSYRDITNVIIPHFDKYPLITQKKADYILFKQGIALLNLKAQSNIEGIRNIISIKASMNLGISDTLKIQFPTALPVLRPVVSFEGKRFYSTSSINTIIESKLCPHWVTGFADAESSFIIAVFKNSKCKAGWSIRPDFTISLHSKETSLLRFFWCRYNSWT